MGKSIINKHIDNKDELQRGLFMSDIEMVLKLIIKM